MLKISSIKDTESAEVEIKNPLTGAALGAFFTIAGPENPQRRARQFAEARRLRKQYQQSGRFEIDDPEEQQQDLIEDLVANTLGWRGITNDDDTPLEFSKEAAASLYARPELGWLRDQLIVAMRTREVFIKACAPT